jgi:hypothetical protein
VDYGPAGPVDATEEAAPPSYLLEAPISKRDARRRSLPPTIAKLVAGLPAGAASAAGALLLRDVAAGRPMLAYPIGSYRDAQDDIRVLEEAGLAVRGDGGESAIACRCGRVEHLAVALEAVDADAIAFVPAADERALEHLDARLARRRFGAGYERSFLGDGGVDTFGVFAFFEQTGPSIEVLGRRSEVLRTLTLAVARERPGAG